MLGIQSTYAKTELLLPQNQVSCSIGKKQSFHSLEKEVQPNIGFLKEKFKFVVLEDISTGNQYEFSEYFVGYLAEGVVKLTTKQIDEYVAFATKQGNQSR